jgi:hypothetical protein
VKPGEVSLTVESPGDRRVARATLILAGITFLLFIATALLWCATQKLVEGEEKAAAASQVHDRADLCLTLSATHHAEELAAESTGDMSSVDLSLRNPATQNADWYSASANKARDLFQCLSSVQHPEGAEECAAKLDATELTKPTDAGIARLLKDGILLGGDGKPQVIC